MKKSLGFVIFPALILVGCVQDPRVDSVQSQMDAQKQEISELREQVRILSAASQEQAALRLLLEDTRRQLASLEARSNPVARQTPEPTASGTQRPFGVDINQGDTRARIIEIPQN